MIEKLFLVSVLVFTCKANAQNGFTVGLQGSNNFPLGRFSEVKLSPPSPIAGEDLATDGFGFGGTIRYGFTFLGKSFAIRINSEYLEMDDKQGEFQVIDEIGNNIGTTDYKFRIIPVLFEFQYYPFTNFYKVKPYASFGLGPYFYSYVNTGPGPKTLEISPYISRFGLNLNLGGELLVYRHWGLDVSINYHVLFLHDGDRVGWMPEDYTNKLQYFQIETGILYNFRVF